MLTRRSILASGLFAVVGFTAPANADEAARAFVKRIYNSYVGPNAKGLPLNESSTLQLFTPALQKFIAADAAQAAKRGEPPALNGDPFVDAQDWKITGLAIEVRDLTPGAAKATVRFKNAGKDVAVSLNLSHMDDDWHIDEIVGPSGSLRKLLTAP